MAIQLKKGEKINLSKERSTLKKCFIGLGWDEKPQAVLGAEFDADVSVILLNNKAVAQSESDFIFYNNLTGAGGAVVHTGDNLDGGGDGDDERINIDLKSLPDYVNSIVVLVTIHDAVERGQNFGMIQNSYVRLCDIEKENTPQEELAYYSLSLSPTSTSSYGVQFASLLKDARTGEWYFSADEISFEGGLAGVLKTYGLDSNS